MQEIEKLARSVFENAEQEPPKEVWDSIEGRLRGSAAAPKGKHRWIWALGAGIAVVGIAVFGVMHNTHNEPIKKLAYFDTASMKDVAEIPVATVVEEPKQEVAKVKMTQVTAEIPHKKEVDKKASTTVETSDYDDEQIFDLLEYQLNSHEYDIPSDGKGMVQNKDNSGNSAATTKEEKSTNGKKDSVEISIMIPNILTPNGDGINDCWMIPDLAKFGKVSVQIFTAQRKRVYASDEYRGDFCGDDLPSGNYFYVLTIRKNNYVRRGVLVIQR